MYFSGSAIVLICRAEISPNHSIACFLELCLEKEASATAQDLDRHSLSDFVSINLISELSKNKINFRR